MVVETTIRLTLGPGIHAVQNEIIRSFLDLDTKTVQVFGLGASFVLGIFIALHMFSFLVRHCYLHQACRITSDSHFDVAPVQRLALVLLSFEVVLILRVKQLHSPSIPVFYEILRVRPKGQVV